ncbi:uncharacterized protein LOC141836320 isoform X2 [Curcuma longa]
MAEVAPEKPPAPAEENTADASLGEIIADNSNKTRPTPEAITENTSETAVSEFAEQKADETPAAEEVSAIEKTTNETTEEQDAEEQEAEEPEIKIETAPADFRFPTTNQTRHCFTRYIEYHRCVAAKGEDAPECNKFAKYYRSLCPSEWV